MSTAEIELEESEYDQLVIDSNTGGGMNFCLNNNGWVIECYSVMNKDDLIKIRNTIQEHLDETES